MPQRGEQRRALGHASRQAGIGWLAADRCLDRIQRRDALQRLQRQRRLRGRVHVEEVPPRVRPARRLGHAAVIQAGISGIAVRLQDAAERCQVRPRMLAFAIGTVAIQHRRRRLAAERPVIAHVAPQPPRLGLAAAGIQHRHRGVVGMHPFRRHDVRADRLDQRTHQPRRLSHPVGQGRAIQVDPGARVDLGLAIQRQVVAVFRHQHMRQQTRPGQAAMDRQAGRRRLGDRSRSSGTTASAAHAG